MYSRSIVLAIALVCSLPLNGRGQVLPFNYYTPEREINPLPSAEVHRVYQDRQGALWFAIYSSGLARYDGTELDLYTTEDGLRDLGLWDVVEDRDGRLWVASNGGLVVSTKPLNELQIGERLRFTDELHGVPLVDVTLRMNTITAHPDGSVWVGTEALGVIRYGIDRRHRLAADTLQTFRREGVSIRSLLARDDGTVWVALSDRRIVAFSSSRIRVAELTAEDGVPEAHVNSMYEDDSGMLYGGCNDGTIWRLIETQNMRPSVEILSTALQSNVSSLALDSRGALWGASHGSGLLTIENGRERLITRENGLLSESVHHVLEDREGNLWFSQTGGIAKLRRNHIAFEGFTSRSFRGEKPLLPSAAVNAIAVSEDDDASCPIWAGTPEGGLACITRAGASFYVTEEDGLRNNWVNALSLDDSGRLWTGTLGGISVLDDDVGPGQRPRIENFGGASIRSISTLVLPDDRGASRSRSSQWFAAIQSVYARLDDEWLIFRDEAGLPRTIFQAIEIDENGHVWIGTRDRGLYRSISPVVYGELRLLPSQPAALSRGGTGAVGREVMVRLFSPVDIDLPSPQVETIRFAGGRLWVGTPSGLAIVDPAHQAVEVLIDRRAGLPAENITSMSLSPDGGTMWIGTNRGLVPVDVADRSMGRVITQQDGLVNSEVWFAGSVATDNEGSVYYGTANGLSIYRPHLDTANELPPLVQIRRVNFTQSPGRSNEIAFEFAALTFSDEKRTLFRTRLDGYEQSWSEPTSERRLRYTNLPAMVFPRRFRFEVTAANESGVWSESPASYTFTVRPPLWLQWWALSIYLVLLAAGIVSVHHIQQRRTIRREREQALLREAQLHAEAAHARSDAAEARARALSAENERKALALEKARELEKAYYELKAAQARLLQAEKMASLGRLAAGIAHEIKNPLNFVNNFASLSQELLEELHDLLQGEGTGLRDEIRDEVDAILADLNLNANKILEHGKRTDSIVRGMLMHSRGRGGEAEEVALNDLVDEYVNLAYHGVRAQHSDFDTEILHNYDPEAGEVRLVPQDIGRVLINLLNNAFYAVHQKALEQPVYVPSVSVITEREDSSVRIRIRDNGPGIPDDVRERIFEPFFTTKPTGEGTGLGLSLSYDIVTQGHGGTFTVESEPGQYTEFVISLPVESTVSAVLSEHR